MEVYAIEDLRLRQTKGVICSAEQGMKVKIIEPRFKQKDGSVFPRRRKLVKKMIMESIVKSLSSLFSSESPKCQIPGTINDVIKGSDVFTINDQ